MVGTTLQNMLSAYEGVCKYIIYSFKFPCQIKLKFWVKKTFLTKKQQQQFLEFANLSNFSLDTDNSYVMGHFGTISCMLLSIMIS